MTRKSKERPVEPFLNCVCTFLTIKHNIRQNIRQDTRQNMRQHARQNLRQHIWQHIRQIKRQRIRQHIRQNMRQNIMQHIRQHRRQNIRQHIRQHLRQHVRQNIRLLSGGEDSKTRWFNTEVPKTRESIVVYLKLAPGEKIQKWTKHDPTQDDLILKCSKLEKVSLFT